MTVAPARFWSSMISIRSRLLTGSKPLVGSSRMSSSGSVHDRDAQLHLLLLALRQLVDACGGLVGYPDAFEVLQRPLPGGGVSEALEPAEVHHHVDDGLLLIQPAFFRQVPKPVSVVRAELPPVDVQQPASGLVDAEKCPNRGRLARAVAAEEAEGLAAPDLEGQILDDLRAAEAHSEVFNSYQWVLSGGSQGIAHDFHARSAGGSAKTSESPRTDAAPNGTVASAPGVPIGLDERPSQDLADVCLGQFFEEDDLVRSLVSRELLLEVGSEFGLGEARVPPHHK